MFTIQLEKNMLGKDCFQETNACNKIHSMAMKPKRLDFDVTWGPLKETVEQIMCGKVSRQEWYDKYWDVYNLCVAYPEPLGDRLYKETKSYLIHHVKNLYHTVMKSSEQLGLLAAYHNQWLEYSQGMEYLNRLYIYLNNQHIKKIKLSDADMNYGAWECNEPLLEIGELGLNIWKIHMIEPLKDSLVKLILSVVKENREGLNNSDSRYVQSVVDSFVEVEKFKGRNRLEFYCDIFETQYLQATKDFYSVTASELIQSHDCSTFMEKVLQYIDQERLRSTKFLDASSPPKVTKECENVMVGSHLEFLYQEAKTMVTNLNRKDLRNMYVLLKPLDNNGLAPLVKEIQNRIEKVGEVELESCVTQDNMAMSFVESVLQVYEDYRQLIKDVFSNDQQFIGALDKACQTIINKNHPSIPHKSPELLAKYCDQLLKKSAKGVSENELEDKLAKSIIVFKYIEHKDLFQKCYSKMLAKRLIHGVSASMDYEEVMINKLKQACGYEFTSKLHRMYTDVNLSGDLNSKFQTYISEQSVDLGLNFSISVLQAGAWPLMQTPISTFAMPLQLEQSVKHFETFYRQKYSGRKLTWLHHLCNADIRLGYLSKVYLVTTSSFQMGILLLFETSDSFTFSEISESTQINDEHLSRSLVTLVESKLLLTDDTLANAESKYSPEAIFNLNLDYSNKRTKFKVTTAPVKEVVQQETEHTYASLEEDRKLFLQALIVRIMKARKVMKHNALIDQVIQQAKSRFVPNVCMIKKCIEALIDKQYIERMRNTADEYSYVA